MTNCPSCKEMSIWRAGQLTFPPPARPRIGAPAHPAMPAAVGELYEEAAEVAAVSRRAEAALARATVERLIKTVDPDAPHRATLAERIERIRPWVTAPVAKMLDVVRYLGTRCCT